MCKLVNIAFLGFVRLIKSNADSKLKWEGCFSNFKQSTIKSQNLLCI